MEQLPLPGQFPACPATWYLFCHSHDLRRGPFSRDVLGRRLVAFRAADGQVAVLEGRCAHLGADLGRGQLDNGVLRCPFHGWEYGADGRCTHAPGCREVPAFARQTCYPAQERHGFVFFFNGRPPLFPLPFFFDEDPAAFVAGRPFWFVADCSWYMLAANGFDAAHFGFVHDRTLTGPAVIDCPAPFARRMHYHADITGRSIFDRLLRRFVGRSVAVSITSWGGPLILVSGFFRRAHSYLIIASQPREDGRTNVEVVVCARRRRGLKALMQPVGLWLRRLFTHGFMQDDLNRLGGIRYNPGGLTSADSELADYFRWAAALPGNAWGSSPGGELESGRLGEFCCNNDRPHEVNA